MLAAFDFNFLTATLTAYVGAQLLIGALAFFIYDIPNLPPHRELCCTWINEHSMNIRVAWLRHLTQSTVALGTWMLATIPLAVTGGATGEQILVFFITAPALLMVHDHTFYALPLLAFGMASRHGNGGTIIIGLIELALLGLLATMVGMLLIRPVVLSGSVVFGTASTPLAAVLICALAMVLAICNGMWQARQAINGAMKAKAKRT